MKKTIVLAFLMVSFVVLQSFQSCSEELVTISIENDSRDTIYCTTRNTDTGGHVDVFDGLRYSYEWKKLVPGERAVSASEYLDDKESKSWKVRIIKKNDMARMPWEGIVDKDLLDSLCSMVKIYSYEDIKALDFCIRFY